MIRFKNIPEKKTKYKIGDKVLICSNHGRVRHMYNMGTVCEVVNCSTDDKSFMLDIIGSINGWMVSQIVDEEDVKLVND